MKRYALLIGINGYQLLGKVKYARQDAEAVAEALCRYYGFTDQDITLMSCRGEGATLGLSRYIEHALTSLTDMHDLGLLVFGFWGHGFSPAPGERYLCGVDTMADDLRRTAISLDVVKSKLAQVQAENTMLMLDCCQNRPTGRAAAADPMTRGEEAALTSLARDIQVAQRDRRPSRIPTVAILNACCEGQKAYEWDSRGHGIFTAHLLDAFARGFDSIAPLSSWTVDRVSGTARKIHHQEQVPFITIEGKGDIALPVAGGATDTARPARRPGLHSRPIVSPPPIPATSAEWWVVIDGQKQGHLNESTMRKMIANGTITSDLLCWQDGMDQWRPIAGTREWGALFGSKPAGPDDTQQDESRLRQFIADDIKQCQASILTGKGSKAHLEKVHQARFDKWRRAAELGWPEGQWLIGLCYDEGLSVAKAPAEAVKWYRKAAEQGDAMAQCSLGFCYAIGDGVARDRAEAVKWFRKAAEQGNAQAKAALKHLKKPFCFITTAVCHTMGLAGNCRELEILRSFRDTFMQQTPQRRNEVKEYYEIAPAIVAAINHQPNAETLWRELARRFILPCVKLADGRQFAKAHRLYKIMVNELRMKYLPETTGSNTNTSRKRR